MGERLVVQFARGSRRNNEFAPQEKPVPRPRRTPYRMQISNLPVETSWQVSNIPHPFGPRPCGSTVYGNPGSVFDLLLTRHAMLHIGLWHAGLSRYV
jgi:hypothetical protein